MHIPFTQTLENSSFPQGEKASDVGGAQEILSPQN